MMVAVSPTINFSPTQSRYPMMDMDVVDVSVVQDALAFIDAFYAEQHTTDEELLTDDDPSDLGTQGLHVALCTLHTKLCRLHPTNPTTQANEHQDIPWLLYECQRLWLEIQGFSASCEVFVLEDTSIANFVRRRLHELTTRVVNGAYERPLLMIQYSPLAEVSDSYFYEHQDGMVVRYRSGRYIPFKLSILAMAAWSVVVDNTLTVPAQGQETLYEHTNEFLLRVHDHANGTQGFRSLRRTCLPDGSILFCWTDMLARLHTEAFRPLNLLKDADTHHFGWLRVGRVTDQYSGRQRVYLESVSDTVVRSVTEKTPDLNRQRFEQFKASELESPEKGGNKNRQLIENRMLEATLKMSSPPVANPMKV